MLQNIVYHFPQYNNTIHSDCHVSIKSKNFQIHFVIFCFLIMHETNDSYRVNLRCFTNTKAHTKDPEYISFSSFLCSPKEIFKFKKNTLLEICYLTANT